MLRGRRHKLPLSPFHCCLVSDSAWIHWPSSLSELALQERQNRSHPNYCMICHRPCHVTPSEPSSSVSSLSVSPPHAKWGALTSKEQTKPTECTWLICWNRMEREWRATAHCLPQQNAIINSQVVSVGVGVVATGHNQPAATSRETKDEILMNCQLSKGHTPSVANHSRCVRRTPFQSMSGNVQAKEQTEKKSSLCVCVRGGGNEGDERNRRSVRPR